MGLFVRDVGPREAPTVVFLHGAHTSGWCWAPVIERLPGYHCLAPDLPRYGKSYQHGPFEMRSAADAVAEIIRSRGRDCRVHLVGFSLGAQVAAQLLATEPSLVGRAVLCGTSLNTLPCVGVTQRALGAFARSGWGQRMIKRDWDQRHAKMPVAATEDRHEDVLLATGEWLAGIAIATSGFTLPAGLKTCNVPTLCLTGSGEMRVVRHWNAAVARAMPNGVRGIANGMRHDWPLTCPDLLARSVDAWLSESDLPAEIILGHT